MIDFKKLECRDVVEVSDCGVYTAGISFPFLIGNIEGTWIDQIECHADTKEEALALRAKIATALGKYATEDEQSSHQGAEMSQQPEALRLAGWLEDDMPTLPQGTEFHSMDKDPASDGFMPFKVSPLKTWFTADQMQAYALEALAAQAASVKPVELWQGRCVYLGGFAGEWKEIHPTKDEPTQELRAAYLASLTHPSGEPSYEIRKLYASAPPSPASVQPVASVLYLSDTGLCSEISEELPWGMDLYASAPPSPTSVPATDIDELREALRMGVVCLRNWKILHPEDFDDLDERAVALLKAALATKEPK